MRKSYLSIFSLASMLTVSASDVVLPTGMKALTPEGVEVTSVDNVNVTKNKKPVVKTADGKIYFSAKTAEAGDELWVTGRTPETTRMVKDIRPGVDGSNPQFMTAVGNNLYFVAETADSGSELWVTDGTEAGTRMVKDIYPGETSSTPFALTAFGDKVLFFALDEESEFLPIISETGTERWLWASDGTEEGTVRIGDVPTREGNYDGQAGTIVLANGKGYFVGYSIEFNETLWVTDGTREGTKPVKDINPRANDGGTMLTKSAAIDWLTPVNDKWVVFRAETVSEVTGAGDVGSEIWVSDGTAEGTKWIGFDFAKGEVDGLPRGTQFALSYTVDNTLYFRADDGIHGVEPCIFDLSKPIVEGENPRMLIDVNHWGNNPSLHSWPSSFHEYNGHLYMQANGGYFLPETGATEYGSGYSLWRVDLATYTNLKYVREFAGMEIYAGNQPDDSQWFTNVGKELYFTAKDNENNQELWCMKTPESVPAKVVDFPENGKPYGLTEVGGYLYFAAEGTKSFYALEVKGGSGLNQTKTNEEVKIYPVPARDVLNIDGDVQVARIFDLQGRLLLTQSMSNTIDTSSLSKGSYIIAVELDGGNTVKRMIIIE